MDRTARADHAVVTAELGRCLGKVCRSFESPSTSHVLIDPVPVESSAPSIEPLGDPVPVPDFVARLLATEIDSSTPQGLVFRRHGAAAT